MVHLYKERHAFVSCTKQFKRNKENLKFQPRWKCTLPKEKIKYSIDKCDNRVHKHTKLASVEAIEERLEDKVVSFTVDEKQVSVGLCQAHYNALYSRLNPTHSCDSCKARPHAGQVFNRHCLSPEIVNTYLRLVINEHNQLSPDSLICTERYGDTLVISLKTSRVTVSSNSTETSLRNSTNRTNMSYNDNNLVTHCPSTSAQAKHSD